MLDSKNYSSLEILHQNESFIYEEFATESIDNIHVKSVNLKTPLASILRVALSDIISSQILASKKDSNSESSKFNLRIYPDALYIVDKNSKKFSSIVLNEKNCDVREYLLQDYQNPEVIANEFREQLFNSDLLTKCAKNYKFKDRNYLVKKSEVEEELGNVLLKQKYFSNHYSNTKFEVSVKSKNRISYKVYVFYDVFKKDNNQFELDETIKDDFIHHFLKKIFVLAISTKRNKEFYRRIKSTTLKSSLAAVMSRNMSHNIGSHVLNKLSSAAAIQDFFALKESSRFVRANKPTASRVEEFIFPNLSIPDEHQVEINNEFGKTDNKKELTLAAFNQKLKNNPKYLEQYKFSTYIGKEDIYTLSPFFVDVNNNTTKEELARVFNDYLKKRMDFVADVATSNKALLNSNKYLFADIFRGFERNLLLLHNISGKEDKFSYEFDFLYCDGTTTFTYGQEGFIDPIVAVPNDVLGSQAFYIILENIIRNTAKHSGSGNVIFTIKVEDLKEDDFYRITVFDNAPHTDIKKLVVNRNVSIAQEVLDENNQIRTAGWGTIEIKLAACYLSGLDMLEMDNKSYWPIGYSAYTTAKEEALKEAIENEESIEEKKHDEKAIEEYINFLSKSDEVILNEKNEYPIDLPETKKRVYLKDNNKVVRYPIVQAVDGSVDETSGFGYSFLMKKPKKLLIIDEADSLEFLEKEKNEELTALKRLGIDIIKTPKRDSIYNHQFMIIVGDENSEHYGDWFNLPQERLLFSIENNSFNNFKFCLKQNCFLLDSNFEYKSFSKGGLPAELLESLKFRIKDKLVPCSAYQIIYENYYGRLENQDTPVYIPEIKINDEKVAAKLSTTFDSELGKVKLKKTASFNHHGLSFKNFENADYAEIYGSTSPLGLYIESVCGRVSEDIAQNYELEIQLKHFIAKGANTPILVIDERIQSVLHQNGCAVEAGEETKEGKKKPYPAYNIKYEDLFAKSNITVLPVGIKLKDQTKGKSNLSLDLNSSNLKDKKINILNYIEKVTNDNSFKYLVIHYGIIEGLRDTSKKETVYSILQEVESSIKSANCQVVITSGRGYTPDIRSLDRYFVNYSTVSNFLLDPYYRSKSHFVECLQQLRKSN